MSPKKIMVICGATGVGKTDLSITLARLFSGCVINADMGQLYKPLSIGTAKPDWQSSDIPHYLFDILDKAEDFSVAAYRKRLCELLPTLSERIPVIVGGSTLYINSLFFPPIAHTDGGALHVKQNGTWHDLHMIDPERAQEIHPSDSYRIQRALTIWHTIHQKPSTYKPIYDPVIPSYSLIMLYRDRDDLYERINTRVKSMFQEGWLREVEHLSADWKSFLLKKKLIGYDDIIHYLRQPKALRNEEILMDTIAQKTRKYAKRQNTFWRMLEKKLLPYITINAHIHKINLTHTSLSDAVEEITKDLHG